MRNLIFTLLLTFIIASTSLSQALTLTLHDQNGAAISYATAVLYASKDSAFIKGEASDDNGLISFETLNAGSYYLEVSYVGYQNLVIKDITIVSTPIVLGVRTLQPNTQTLNQVTITARKPMLEIKADKMVLNPDASIAMAGLNALELLRKAPGVVIDNNENIQLKGKNGVRIYIDGKPSMLSSQDLANLLKGLQSSDIEAVEIITNPSAKYDAQGNAGIINIKMKKNKNLGTNGSINVGGGYGKYHKSNAGINLNNRNGKLNTFGSLGLGDNRYYNEMTLDRSQNNTNFYQNQTQVNDNTPINTKVGVDYYLSSKHTLGLLANYNGQLRDKIFTSDSKTLIKRISSTTLDSMLIAKNNQISRSNNANINLNYRYEDTLGNEITFDIDRGLYSSRENSNQPNSYFTPDNATMLSSRNAMTSSPSDIGISTLKLDYTKTLKSSPWSIAAGAKYAVVSSDNTFNFFNEVDKQAVKDIHQSNKFYYEEKVGAMYLNINGKINDKFAIQTGLRMENTRSLGDLTRDISLERRATDSVPRQYTNLFPSGVVTYTMNANHVLNFSYSRRLDRPNYQELNPFNYRLDELTYRKGNPFLTPQYNNNFELTYTVLQSMNIGLSYSKSTKVVTDIIEPDLELPNATFINYRNIAIRDHFTFSVNTPLPIAKWWNGYLSANLYKMYFKAAFEEYSFDTETPISTNIYAENNFTLPKDLGSFEVSGWFNSASIWGGTFLTKPQGSLDLGYKKVINGGLTTVKLGYTDILFTAGWRMQSNSIPGLDMNLRGSYESRRVNFNVSHRFGNKNVKGARNRKTGMQDEAGRIK